MMRNVCREVDEVREERLRRELDRFRKEQETNRQRFVNLYPHHRLLSILMANHIVDWLGKEQMIEMDMQSSTKS